MKKYEFKTQGMSLWHTANSIMAYVRVTTDGQKRDYGQVPGKLFYLLQ